MNLKNMKKNHKYIITSYGTLKENEIEQLNQIGFIKGEVITKCENISCNNSMCLFNIENTTFSINRKYIKEVVIKEVGVDE